MINKYVFILLFFVAACDLGKEKNTVRPYVIAVKVEAQESPKSPVLEKVETDTIDAGSALAAYSKGVQKYAAVLLDIHRHNKLVKTAAGTLEILDENTQNVVPELPREKRDSVIMNFIQFARKSSIPYYEHVKDFELKMMGIR